MPENFELLIFGFPLIVSLFFPLQIVVFGLLAYMYVGRRVTGLTKWFYVSLTVFILNLMLFFHELGHAVTALVLGLSVSGGGLTTFGAYVTIKVPTLMELSALTIIAIYGSGSLAQFVLTATLAPMAKYLLDSPLKRVLRFVIGFSLINVWLNLWAIPSGSDGSLVAQGLGWWLSSAIAGTAAHVIVLMVTGLICWKVWRWVGK